MKISEKKALEILHKDFATLREQAKLAATSTNFILHQAVILADRIGQLLATQSEPASRTPSEPSSRTPLPNGNPLESEEDQEHEKPLTLS